MPPPPTGAPDATPVVVLASGSGTLLQALLDASADSGHGIRVVAVGADREGTGALERAARAGVPGFVVRLRDHQDRASWDAALASAIAVHRPSLVVSAGFMKILGPRVLERFLVLNSHPALLPAFPGAHAVVEALAAGVGETGCTVHVVDAGVDTGPVLARRAVPVLPGDTAERLHERIKQVERPLLVDVVARVARERRAGNGKVAAHGHD